MKSGLVSLITIGDELLLGLRANSHLTTLGESLRLNGATLSQCLTIRDEPDAILQTFRYALQTSDIIISTGGLGPTTDDCTRSVIADLVGRSLIKSEIVEQHIRQILAKKGREPSATSLSQAFIPEGATILPNANGTAPGLEISFEGKHIFLLPGPPREMIPIFEEEVLPRLGTYGFCDLEQFTIISQIIGVGESEVQDTVLGLAEQLGIKPSVAYCAHQGIVDVRLSTNKEHNVLATDVKELSLALQRKMGKAFLCFGQKPLAQVLLEHLEKMGVTLSVAESCTGGLLASTLTDVPGSSKVFRGGAVCYSDEQKKDLLRIPEEIIQQHTSVSEECALAMANECAALFQTDYALSVTGFAGPSGGNDKDPVGTIYIGYYSPQGTWAYRMEDRGSRTFLKAKAVQQALDWMRKKLYHDRVQDTWVASQPPFPLTSS